jgi:hypothetical protein
MGRGKTAAYRAAGVQSRLRARAGAAATRRAKAIRTRVAIAHSLLGGSDSSLIA